MEIKFESNLPHQLFDDVRYKVVKEVHGLI